MLLPFEEPWMLLLKNVADIYRENSGFLSLKRGMWEIRLYIDKLLIELLQPSKWIRHSPIKHCIQSS